MESNHYAKTTGGGGDSLTRHRSSTPGSLPLPAHRRQRRTMPDVHRRSQLHPLRPSCSQANESAAPPERSRRQRTPRQRRRSHFRLTRRDAVAFAYISQLLLNSVSALDRERESEEDRDDDETSSRLLSMFHKRDNEDNHATSDGRACR